MYNPPFKSQRIAAVAGGTYDVPLDFLPTVGQRKGRNAIDYIVIDYSCIVVNPVGVTVEGEDAASLIERVIVKDSEGERRDLLGREVRMKEFLDMTDSTVPESLDIPANATTTAHRHLRLHFRQKVKAHRDADYFMGVDDLLNGGSLQIATSTVGTIESTGGAPTSVWGAGSWIQVYVFLAERHDLEYFVRDLVKSYSFASALEHMVPINGKLLRELVVYKNVATEAARDVASIDTVSIEPYRIQSIPGSILADMYIVEDEVTAGTNIIGVNVQPLVFPGRNSKVPDYLLHGGQLLVRFDGASAAFAARYIAHTLAPKSEAMAVAAAATARVGAVDATVKTAKGSSDRDPRMFGPHARFMAAKQKMIRR